MTEIVEIKGVDELNRYLSELPEKSFDEIKPVFKKSVLSVQRKVATRIKSGPLHNRTGFLAKSLRTQVKGTNLKTLSGSVYSDSVYAPIQEYGGTIKAKRAYRGVPNGPYLNIPLDANKTASGVMRNSTRDVFNDKGFIFKSRNGRYFVASKDGVPMFVLVKQVKIPARLGMRKSAEDEVETLLSNVSKALNEAIQ